MTSDANKYLRIYQATREYLRIAPEYTAHFGRLVWSKQEDAVVTHDGKMFALNGSIAEFLDGFSDGRRVISFSLILHAMELLQDRRRLSHPQAQRLHRLFYHDGHWRNAGALFAVLTTEAPELSPAPALQVVSARLRDVQYPVRWFMAQEANGSTAVEPALTPHQFEDLLFHAAEAYTNDELAAWFSTGRGPVHEAARDAARETHFAPRSLSGVLASLLQRPRLAGAETHVTQMVGALALPPRRWSPTELPVGGYADMVTRGQIEQILPSQHALDDDEFLRRFAENELMYFRREEPPAQNQQEWTVLLDQGVRTWGDVRLVLSAATLALGRLADQRKIGFRISGTSNGGQPLDPLEANVKQLGELLEASDLTLNPAEALEQTLQTRSESLRDVVLLTHPRSLREADVLAAARRLGPRDRLFALTLDGAGRAALCEVRHGAAIALKQFHVEFQPTVAPPPTERTSSNRDIAWTGDLEPVPFPFKIGSTGPIEHYDLDNHSLALLTVDKRGVLQLWHLDDEVCETLPRVQIDGHLVTKFNAVMGIPGGFVLATKTGAANVLVIVNLIHRYVWARILPDGRSTVIGFYFSPAHHSVVLQHHDLTLTSFDLDSGELHWQSQAIQNQRSRAVDAWNAASENRLLRNQRELTRIAAISVPRDRSHYQMQYSTGEITLVGPRFPALPMIPRADGLPLLVNAPIYLVQTAGDHVLLHLGTAVESRKFLLFDGVNQCVVREYPQKREKTTIHRALLSPDGTRVALLLANHRIVIDNIATGEIFTTRSGGFSQEIDIFYGLHCIVISSRQHHRHWHLIDWADGKLFHFAQTKLTAESEKFIDNVLKEAARPADQLWVQIPAREKFSRCGLVFRIESLQQVSILDGSGTLLVIFLAFRGQVAAWMKDGTRYGAESLHLGPVTPDAAQKIGRALLDAETKVEATR